MKFGKYLFHIKLTRDAVLPAYKGPIIRGLSGPCLENERYVRLKTRPAPPVFWAQNCTYAPVFETAHAPAGSGKRQDIGPPHPMVLEPPLTKREFAAGDFACGMVLFGT